MLICDFVFNFCILLNLRAFINVLSCETLKMFGLLEVCFGSCLIWKLNVTLYVLNILLKLEKIMHDVDAC